MINKHLIEQIMKLALQEAEKAIDVDQVPVAGLFVKIQEGNQYKIIKSAHNMTTKTKNASEHSQMICLKELERQNRLEQVKDMILFVTVEPCIMCTHALNLAKIKYVYFGQFNDRFGGCGSVLKLNQFECEGGHFAEESKNILKYFYQKGNQKLPEEKRHRKKAKNY